jgi:DNA-binding NtrC family response regulator
MNDFRVLFVDDEVDFLDTLLKRMRKRRVNVSGVKSGEDALEWLSGNIADVVVLDVRMPGMDGIETLRAIKKLNPLVEIIMLTGHANLEVARKGMELGAFDYLMKPIDIDELLYKVQDACKKKSIHEKKIKNINHLIDSDR